MKVYSNRSQEVIKTLRAPSILLYGNDGGEVTDIERKIIKSFLPLGVELGISIIDLESQKIKENPSVLYNEIAERGFFSDKKLIRIRDAADSLAKILESALENLPNEVFILVTSGELSKSSSMRKLYEESAKLQAILCYRDDIMGLRNYMVSEFKKHGISITQDALDFLVANLGDNKSITNNEIEKIITYLGENKSLELDDLLSLLAENSEPNVINLAFSVAGKDKQKLEKDLANLFTQNQNAVSILRMVIWHFNRLINTKSLIEKGVSADQVIKSLRPPIFYKQADEFNKSLRSWPLEKLSRALEKLTKAELEAKRGVIDPELVCSRVLLSLAA